MRAYRNKDEEQLKSLADNNDAVALAETGFRLLSEDNKDEAKKYLRLAMQLGETEACFTLGDLCYSGGDADGALEAFKEGRRCGDENCTYAYAALMLTSGDSESLDIILNYANDGHAPSIELLEDYYRELGNKREAEYWRKKGNSIDK